MDKEKCERRRTLTHSADNSRETERCVSVQWCGSVPERFTAVRVNNQEERKEFKERSKSNTAGGPIREPVSEDAAARRSTGRRLTYRSQEPQLFRQLRFFSLSLSCQIDLRRFFISSASGQKALNRILTKNGGWVTVTWSH